MEMKKFIRLLFKFSLIIIALNTVIFVVKELTFSPYYLHPTKYKSYLLSDSHGYKLYDLTEKIGVANFSFHSESYLDIYRKLMYLTSRNKTDTLYISVDDHTLSPYREISNNDYKSIKYNFTQGNYNFLDYAIFKLQYYIVIFDPNIRAIITHFIGSQVKKLFSFADKNKVNANKAPWSSLSRATKLKLAEARVKEQFPSDTSSKKLEKSLLEIINLCKQKNIKLIGIKFPLSGEFLEILGNKSYKADSILISQGIEVWDFKSIFSNIDNYFEDPDHVNPEGANVLIDSLSRRAGIKNLQLLHN
ncbi:MAG: hypothetical protein AB9833_08145 [Bacteroidales bacterium]